MPYEAYFKSASESLVVVDRRGRIAEMNAQTERLFGYSKAELLGQPVEILLPERLREQHRGHRDAFLSAPHSRPMGIGLNLAARRKDGSEFPVEVSLTYAQGTSRGDLVVAALIDITERLALEREARRAETLTSLGTIAAGIAHDLNNPLSVILARAELLLAMPSDALQSAQLQEDLAVIHRQAQRASRIVQQFLELSRHGPKLVAPVNLNDLIERVLLLIGEQVRKAGIDVETDLDWNLPPVLGDAIALERVLINLLTNARDAMANGGAVTITTDALRERPGWLRLRVADNGHGIEPAALSKVFDLLYTTKPGGSGLGLWLSRRIVQEHKGRMEVHSELGRGTTFTISVPGTESSSHD
jgi:PAS domain S-box-containing protein